MTERRIGTWWSCGLLMAVAVGIATAMLSTGCNSRTEVNVADPEVTPAQRRHDADRVAVPTVRFMDVTEKAGIHFRHTNGSFGKKLLPETMGSGVAFLDFDRDGNQDILFVNSCYWPGHEGKERCTLRLYRNKGDGTFEDVTERVGLNLTIYGMGVTVGDYDNDGWPDIFITAVGGNHLFHNLRGQRFEDVTATAGVRGEGRWPTPTDGEFLQVRTPLGFPSSAAFLDYDGDGKLDLFVCNYVTWSPDFDLKQPFQLKGEGRAYGPPTVFEGAQCILYRNLGNGRFEDVSAKAGIQVFEKEGLGEQARPRSIAKSLGICVFTNQIGYPDIVVANDTVRNFHFHNLGDGRFEEIGVQSGVGYADSKARGAMGIDAGWYRPKRFALCIANYAEEPDTFLRLDDETRLFFSDAAMAEGVAGPSRPLLKFGTFFFDYDLDGRLDLLTCNGHLEPEINKVEPGQTYEQPAQLFWNCSGTGNKSSFMAVGEREAGSDLFRPMVGRGSAFADINKDGYPDVVLSANGGVARLLRNEGGTKNNWVRLVLEGDGVRSNSSAIGARVALEAGGMVQRLEVRSGRGYLSQSELPLTFGVGKADKIDRVVIEWPGRNGGKEEHKGLDVNKEYLLHQGEKIQSGTRVAAALPRG
jgi:enediyne biosynthesis protein E4